MNLQPLRNVDHENHTKATRGTRRHQHQITYYIPEKHQQIIEKYIRNAERGRLPMFHDGADVTRPLTMKQVTKFLNCGDCLQHPILSIQFKNKNGSTKLIGLCSRHWERLADTVIGWSGE